MNGRHLLQHWSSTQGVVALSSAEAELNALVKAVSETLGVSNMCRDIDLHMTIEVRTDSSAAKGIVCRRGAGKVKHLETWQLWIQEHVESGSVQCVKIPRERNFSDLLTHHWAPGEAWKFKNGLQVCSC